MIRALKTFLVSRPLNVVVWKAWTAAVTKRIPMWKQWILHCRDKKALEIGGPSGVFNNYLPVYTALKAVDGVNFSAHTIWDSPSAKWSKYNLIRGDQIVADGVNLSCIDDESYEVVLSSNNLEHIANPVKALIEWKRVLKPGGVLICVLPRKESNFDHRRSITKLEHLINDYENKIGEEDLTHLEEILRLHNLKRDPLAGCFEDFKRRSIDNYKHRALHHHVFDIPLLQSLMKFIGMDTVLTHSSPMDHFIMARK